ncbi:hypothetical protein CEE37_06260 [candidate division LCP-89 bacterium B3_LCP]|uniref:Secretion system C-terminal sorting domain-containing protein n=1 Tax=candidate division LCP-89 bacterium B3_LCP TaxID=2012998 RepID=A0A532V2P7_UNCL8|nr:MAG: hypothetical protein CEE37_06260 [candidate division LCP-89 bacterium B3_LCP]
MNLLIHTSQRLFFAFLFITIIASMANSDVWEHWVVNYNSHDNYDDQVSAIAVDSLSNVYLAGYTEQNGEPLDMVTIKYSSAGVQQWVAVYDGSGQRSDKANAIAIDDAGHVYIAGYSTSGELNRDIVLIRYSQDGQLQWVSRFDGAGAGDDEAASIQLDDAGNIYLTGYSVGLDTGSDITTIKYNPSGTSIWTANYHGQGNGDDFGKALSLDDSGNVYVTGYSFGDGTGYDYVTIKYNNDGEEQWVASYNGTGNDYDEAVAIAIDADYNVIVTGYSEGLWVYEDYTTVKYDAQGGELWVARYDGPSNWTDIAKSLVLDQNGNIYVTGYSYVQFSEYDYTTIKYSSSGSQEWIQSYNGQSNGDDRAQDIAIDFEGNIYVTGYTNTYVAGADYTTIKYSSAGSTLWESIYNDPDDSEDQAVCITLDEIGDVYVSGFVQNSEDNNDITTIKYSQTPPEIILTLDPTSTIIFPPTGGTLTYSITIENMGSYHEVADIWTDVTIPLGVVYGPVLGPVYDFIIPLGSALSRERQLQIPLIIPAGTYTMNGYAGIYDVLNPVIFSEDHFDFYKEEAGSTSTGEVWFVDSELAPSSVISLSSDTTPDENIFLNNTPNPFNPRTVISFELRVASYVTLEVFDINGRAILVGERHASPLQSTWYPSGSHHIPFDGSSLSSGIYIYRLAVNGEIYTRKMMLLK